MPTEQNRKAEQREEEAKTASTTVNLLGSHPEQTAHTQGGTVGPVKTKDKSLPTAACLMTVQGYGLWPVGNVAPPRLNCGGLFQSTYGHLITVY